VRRVVDVVAVYGGVDPGRPLPSGLPTQSSKGSCMRYVRQGEEALQGWELSRSADAVAHISLSPSRLSVLLKWGTQAAPD